MSAPQQKSAHIALSDRIRGMIESGELKPGHRFPPTKELAKQWKTYPLAVHNAFQILSNAGLVDRLHRQGTFVSRSSTVLGTVAVYLGTDLMSDEHMKFGRTVYAELMKTLKEENVRADALLDPRDDDHAHMPWPQLVKSIARKEYQGVIALGADAPRMKWLERLPTLLASNNDLASPTPDFARLALTSLVDKGCRSIASITSFEFERDEFHSTLRSAVKKRDVELRPEWQMRPKEWVRSHAMERYGYDQFIALWKSGARPDGLIAFPDNLAPGLLAAMQRLGVRAPDDVRLALHKNKEIDLVCPFPTTFIVYSAAEFAKGIVQQLKRKLSGEAPPPLKLTCGVEENTP